MSAWMRYSLAGVLVATFALLASCGETRPDLPQLVKVAVEVPKPLPDWATDALPVPVPVNGTVGARATSHDARGAVIELANCHRALSKRLSRGEDVDPAECGPEGPQ